MSKKGGGIGIGTIIFWAWLAYMFFGGDGDDEKSKVVEIKSEDEVSTEKPSEEISKHIHEAVGSATKAFEEVKEASKKAVGELQREFDKSTAEVQERKEKGEQVVLDKTDEETKEGTIERKKKETVESFRPVEENHQEEKGMKKL